MVPSRGHGADVAARLAPAAERGRPARTSTSGCSSRVFGATLVAIVLRGRDALDDAWGDGLVTSIVEGVRGR